MYIRKRITYVSYIHTSVCYLFILLSLFLSLSIYLSLKLFIPPFFCFTLSLSIYLFISPSLFPSISLSPYSLLYLSLPISLFFYISPLSSRIIQIFVCFIFKLKELNLNFDFIQIRTFSSIAFIKL